MRLSACTLCFSTKATGLAVRQLLLLAVSFCGLASAWGQSPTGWKLAWSDEFDGPVGSLPDAAKWKYQSGPGAKIGGNDEAEYYCAPDSPAPCKANQPNAYMDGKGHLVLAAVHTDAEVTVGVRQIKSPVYTSARLVTVPTFQYGRLEASLRLPIAGKGVWPAFWGMGQETGERHWPAVGEIDVMEQWNPQPGSPDTIDASTIHGAVHGPLSAGSAQGFIDQSADYVVVGNPSTAFHQYAVEWSPGEVDFYVDGVLYHRTSPASLTGKEVWAQDGGPFSLLLNLAMGGGFFGYPDASTAPVAVLLVDYVRVFQRSEGSLGQGWSNVDIGGPAVAGDATLQSGIFEVSGSGAGISGRFDQFHYAYKAMAGDGEVSAHLLSQTSQVAQAKAGVMLREGRGAAAPYAMIFRSPDGSVHFRFRTTRGDVPGEVLSKSSASWMKLGRHGDILTGYLSTDGKTWTAIGDARLPVRRDLLAGLISTSRDNKAPNHARFDYVDVTRSDAAFDGEPAELPGVVQAEQFNRGGTGFSYSTELGEKGPVVAAMPESVVQATGAGGYFVRVPSAGRYINYAVHVTKEGDYTMSLRAASMGKGGSLHFNLDQKPLSAPFALTDTGNLSNWQAMSGPVVHLTAGDHTLALVTDSNSASDAAIDAISFRPR